MATYISLSANETQGSGAIWIDDAKIEGCGTESGNDFVQLESGKRIQLIGTGLATVKTGLSIS